MILLARASRGYLQHSTRRSRIVVTLLARASREHLQQNTLQNLAVIAMGMIAPQIADRCGPAGVRISRTPAAEHLAKSLSLSLCPCLSVSQFDIWRKRDGGCPEAGPGGRPPLSPPVPVREDLGSAGRTLLRPPCSVTDRGELFVN